MTGPKATLLLVEDDEGDVFLFRRAFARVAEGILLTVAPDAPAARRCLAGCARRESPDALPRLALFDVKLPGESGLELLAWVRGMSLLSRLPVVIFTSSLEQKDRQRARDLGADAYVVKPAGFEALFRVLKELTDYWFYQNRDPEGEKTWGSR